MVTILREADKAPVAEVSKRHGISEQTNYSQHVGGMEAANVTAPLRQQLGPRRIGRRAR